MHNYINKDSTKDIQPLLYFPFVRQIVNLYTHTLELLDSMVIILYLTYLNCSNTVENVNVRRYLIVYCFFAIIIHDKIMFGS